MLLTNTSSGTTVPSARTRDLVLWGIAVIEILVLCVPGKWWEIGGLSTLVLFAAFGLLIAVLRGRGDSLILGWILIFPLGYYFLSYPRVHPVITLDRVFISVLLVTACLAPRAVIRRIHPSLRKPAVYWALFLFFAAITIPRCKVPLNSLRTLLDGFLFPALLAWYLLRYFDVRKYLSVLHVFACLTAIYIGAIGAAEVVLQRDLLATPESAIFLAGDYQDQSSQIWVRPNGPFSSTNSFALIGLVSLFFISFLKSAHGEEFPLWQRTLHWLAILAALATAIMPLFRSVFTSLVVILLVDAYFSHGARRAIRAGIISGFLAIGLLASLALPSVFEERSAPENLFGRIAEQRQILAMFLDKPLNGVGLNNFYYEASQKDSYTAYYAGVQSVDYPHNNLGAVLSETGLAGFLPFVASQWFLIAAFWGLRRTGNRDGLLVWKSFLFIFLGYWINGMSLTSGYYGDLNLWYMCALAVMFKYAQTAAPVHAVPD